MRARNKLDYRAIEHFYLGFVEFVDIEIVHFAVAIDGFFEIARFQYLGTVQIHTVGDEFEGAIEQMPDFALDGYQHRFRELDSGIAQVSGFGQIQRFLRKSLEQIIGEPMNQRHHDQHASDIEQGVKHRQFHRVIVRRDADLAADAIHRPDELADEYGRNDPRNHIKNQVAPANLLPCTFALSDPIDCRDSGADVSADGERQRVFVSDLPGRQRRQY